MTNTGSGSRFGPGQQKNGFGLFSNARSAPLLGVLYTLIKTAANLHVRVSSCHYYIMKFVGFSKEYFADFHSLTNSHYILPNFLDDSFIN